MKCKKPSAVITGARSGLGRAFAFLSANREINLVLVAPTPRPHSTINFVLMLAWAKYKFRRIVYHRGISTSS